MNAKIFVETLNKAIDDFEKWWAENYEGRLGQAAIETAIKEVAKKSWEESVHNMIQNHNFIQQRLSAEAKASTLPEGNVR